MSRSPIRFTISVALALTACVAPWSALVEYSEDRASPGEDTVDGVYMATLQRVLITGGWPRVAEWHRDPSMLPVDPGGSVIRSHWADTLKREVRAATDELRSVLRDCAAPPIDHIAVLAMRLGIELRDTTDARSYLVAGRDSLPVPELWLSVPGFNADSTVAAIEVDYWCGGLCGHGATLLLARRPGYRWQVWRYHTHWVS